MSPHVYALVLFAAFSSAAHAQTVTPAVLAGAPAGAVAAGATAGPGQSPGPDVRPDAPAGGAPVGGPAANACATDFAKTGSICDPYLNPPQQPRRGVDERYAGIDPQVAALMLNGDFDRAIAASSSASARCANLATACLNSCGQAHDPRTGPCRQKMDDALTKHKKFEKMARNQQSELDKHRTLTGADNPPSPGRTPSTPEYAPASTPPASQTAAPPSQTGPKDSQPEKTAEQKKEERREAREAKRREERINALGQAFMALNQQKPLEQALQERPAEPTAQAAARAAKVAEKTSPAKDTSDDNDDPIAQRAGFNALAKQNLAARRAVATAMGLQPKSAATPAAASKTSFANGGQGSVFPAGSTGFGLGTGAGARLDSVVEAERPSDLPKNFRLEAPAAGGGGGGGAAAYSQTGRKAQKGDDEGSLPKANHRDTDDDDQPARGIASLQESPWQIRERNANIFNVVSTAFRSRCAQGRLLDCAEHLPKH